MWHEFWVAIALLFIIEGLWPFLHPEGFQKALRLIASQDARVLRGLALLNMMIGLLLLQILV